MLTMTRSCSPDESLLQLVCWRQSVEREGQQGLDVLGCSGPAQWLLDTAWAGLVLQPGDHAAAGLHQGLLLLHPRPVPGDGGQTPVIREEVETVVTPGRPPGTVGVEEPRHHGLGQCRHQLDLVLLHEGHQVQVGSLEDPAEGGGGGGKDSGPRWGGG